MNEPTSATVRSSGKRSSAAVAHPYVRWDRAAVIAVMLTVWTFLLKFVAGL
jgi:hypothetical protein